MTVLNKNPRLAISQPYIILGGRLEVILGLVKALNGLGIEPDILCLALAFPPDQIEQKYGYQLRMKFRVLLPLTRSVYHTKYSALQKLLVKFMSRW